MLFIDASHSGHIAFSEVGDLAEVNASQRRRTFWRHEHVSKKKDIATETLHPAI